MWGVRRTTGGGGEAREEQFDYLMGQLQICNSLIRYQFFGKVIF